MHRRLSLIGRASVWLASTRVAGKNTCPCSRLSPVPVPPSRAVADFSGLVVSVLDSDTIEVLHNDRPERIRLSGIDCPEKGQAYGMRAKQAASELVLGGEVTLQTYGHDKYGRALADVLLLDGTNVNHTLIKPGWCWWYQKYPPGNTELEGLEKEARESKKGLWVGPTHVPPWEWRKRKQRYW